jgi:aspartate--ammonia ligase
MPIIVADHVTDSLSLILPEGYNHRLTLRQTEEGIKYIKDGFERRLAAALNLTRVSAPIFVQSGTGLNDHLSGVEQPVRFSVAALGCEAEIVQSLAKWKRMALAMYGFGPGEGLYTDMNAIRPDETPDNLHSIYVDQWDWERVIGLEERTLDTLRAVVQRIYGAIVATKRDVCAQFGSLSEPFLPQEITFVHAEELALRYPELSPRQREHAICREHGAVFVIGIGAPLADGTPHDARAADYDDWSTVTLDGRRGLNGDILVWYPVLGCALELSSMGIRVDANALEIQLALKGEADKLDLYYHRSVMSGAFPLTIGGGIGQSRLCMLFLRRAHVGEVQASIWPPEMVRACRQHGVVLL